MIADNILAIVIDGSFVEQVCSNKMSERFILKVKPLQSIVQYGRSNGRDSINRLVKPRFLTDPVNTVRVCLCCFLTEILGIQVLPWWHTVMGRKRMVYHFAWHHGFVRDLAGEYKKNNTVFFQMVNRKRFVKLLNVSGFIGLMLLSFKLLKDKNIAIVKILILVINSNRRISNWTQASYQAGSPMYQPFELRTTRLIH